MDELLWVARAVADPVRLRLLALISARELCLCQVVAVLRLAPSTLSRHLSLLQRAGLSECRKEGRWHYYRLARRGRAISLSALRWLMPRVRTTREARADKVRLVAVLRLGKSELCLRYRLASRRMTRARRG